MSHLILVVDDDPHIRELVTFALTRAGYQVQTAQHGEEALRLHEALRPDLIILDIMMPELDGTEVCRQLRRRASTPIIFLSSRDDEIDRILGLELGGDDYVSKPFSPRELVARVRAVLRRAEERATSDLLASPRPAPPLAARDASSQPPPRQLAHGKLRLDLDLFQAYWQDHEVVLTVTEFGVLRTLLGYPGKVFTRDELMRGAYREQTIVSDRTIDSHITRLRRKFEALGAQPVETVHGLGYKCGPCQ